MNVSVVSIELYGLNFETSGVRCRSKIWAIPKEIRHKM